jgi:hypothetical protein
MKVLLSSEIILMNTVAYNLPVQFHKHEELLHDPMMHRSFSCGLEHKSEGNYLENTHMYAVLVISAEI